jgi:hypothetical protein
MVADARAKMAEKAGKAEKLAASTPLEVAVPLADAAASHGTGLATPTSDSGPAASAEVKPLEDRYLDDGTVTVDDRKKFSLRSGPNTSGHPVRGAAVIPGERMSETEVLEEIGGGRRLLVIGLVVVVGLVAAGVIWTLTRGAGHGGSPTPAPGPTAEPSPPAAPVAPQAEAVPPPTPTPTPLPSGEAAPLAGSANPGSTESPDPAAAGSADLAQAEPSSTRSSARKKTAAAGKKKAAATAKKTSSSTKPHR